jgi:hypothetical protein
MSENEISLQTTIVCFGISICQIWRQIAVSGDIRIHSAEIYEQILKERDLYNRLVNYSETEIIKQKTSAQGRN